MSMSRINKPDEPSHAKAQEGNILLYDLLVQEGRVIGADRGFEDVDVVLENCLRVSSGSIWKTLEKILTFSLVNMASPCMA
jgi:hypothetical protein